MVNYPDIFHAGDKARCKKFVRFVDGTYHQNGEIIKVTKKNKSYFNVNHNDYEKVECQT